MTGGAVSGPVILGGAGPEHSLDRGSAAGASWQRWRVAYGWFEAGWLRTRVLDVPVAGLPAALDGLRIAHLSDFHLGPPSRGARRRPPGRGLGAGARPGPRRRHRRPALASPGPRRASTRRCAAWTRTSCSATTTSRSRATRSRARRSSTGSPRRCSRTSRSTVVRRGERIQLAGIAPLPDGALPRSGSRRRACASCSATIRGCASPATSSCSPGHMHAGQIVLPYPGGKIRFAHLRSRLTEGLYREGGVTLHVSPGLGTTFVPFRLFARPEVTELVLREST